MKTKKTVTPFNMQEIARALREMISEDSPNASEALLSGTREAVFREIFIFHYPSFLEKLYQSIPEVDKDEELICMLVALGQSVKEIAERGIRLLNGYEEGINIAMEQVDSILKPVLKKECSD